MTGLGFTGDIVAIMVLLLVIGITWFALRSRLGDAAASLWRKLADKGKIKCRHPSYGGDGTYKLCKNKAGWVTPNGYFCDDHWEINSRRKTADGSRGRVRWAHKLAWKRLEKLDVWTT